MKVKIWFDNEEKDELHPNDPESMYESVEFETVQACDPEGWAYAVLDFLRPCGYVAGCIAVKAYLQADECGWDRLADLLCENEINELQKALSSRTRRIRNVV